MLRRSLLLAVFVLATACSGTGNTLPGDAIATFPDDAIPIRVNSDISVGAERVLVAVAQLDGTRLGSPDDHVTVEVRPVSDPTQVQTAEATFEWTIEEGFGFYRARFDFDQTGQWLLTVIPEVGDPLDTILIEVADDECRSPDSPLLCAPRVGEPAPSLATPTLAEAEIADLTTDPDPDERLYQLSLDDALGNGRPTVVVFATPAYCQTATCGPMLANVKPVVDERPDVDFVHIEVYTGLRDPDFFPGPEALAPAVIAWALPSEPWVFVVDGTGIITARFEGTMTTDELREQL